MIYSVRIRAEANTDLIDASSWYELQQSGLGQDFLDNFSNTLDSIKDTPLSFPKVKGEVHRALLQRFPFGVYFFIRSSTISIIAVMHCSRHPQRWQTRK